MWIVFAVLAALLAGTSVTLTKAGLEKVDPFLAFAIQSIFIFAISWGTVLFQKNASEMARMDRKAWLFVTLAGVATCLSSLSQFKALKMGNSSLVSPLVSSSLVFSVLFAALFLKDQLNWKIITGVAMIIGGAVLVALSARAVPEDFSGLRLKAYGSGTIAFRTIWKRLANDFRVCLTANCLLFSTLLYLILPPMATVANLPSKIFLTGLMGSGKSYWGRQLAARFQIPFLDLDKGIEMAERTTIANIFNHKGEAYFREAERNTLQELMAHPRFVMSCGGGTPCFYDNMAVMKSNGTVVWLNPPLTVLSQRLMPGRFKRPLIRNAQTEEDITIILLHLLEKRKPFYEMSDCIVDTPHPTFETFENLLLYA